MYSLPSDWEDIRDDSESLESILDETFMQDVEMDAEPCVEDHINSDSIISVIAKDLH